MKDIKLNKNFLQISVVVNFHFDFIGPSMINALFGDKQRNNANNHLVVLGSAIINNSFVIVDKELCEDPITIRSSPTDLIWLF
jgi:hypothetical protein